MKMISTILAIMVLLTMYLAMHLYLVFAAYMPKIPAGALAFVCFCATQLIWANYFMVRVLHWPIPKAMFTVGFFIGIFALMLMFCFCVTDVFKLTGFYPEKLKKTPWLELAVFSSVSISVVLLGFFGTVFTKQKELIFVSDKVKKETRIVFMSDLHIGSADITPGKLEKWVEKVNAFNPDLVLFGGDVLDGSKKPFEDEKYEDIFHKIKAKSGVYGVLGNHEYYGEGVKEAVEIFEGAGIRTLRDQSVKIEDLNISLIGRDDTLMGGFGGEHVKETRRVDYLMAQVPKDDYKIVISHNPIRFDEAVAAGADLQLSGHTHAGQLFPANIIVKFIYEKPYGLLEKKNSKLYTTSGFGSWGPPIRIFTRSEIVFITIKPEDKKKTDKN